MSVPPKDHHRHLLVEGRDDMMAIGSLLARHGVEFPTNDWHPYINPVGGIPGVLETIPVALRGSYQRLGVVVDADVSLEDRWAQTVGAFHEGGVELPDEPPIDGAIVERTTGLGPHRVGVWLMPNNQVAGMLEDFLSMLVPDTDLIWPIASDCTSKAIIAGAPLPPAHESKGRIHTYLAWQDPSGLPFGTALTARILGHDAEVAAQFMAWVRKLFELA